MLLVVVRDSTAPTPLNLFRLVLPLSMGILDLFSFVNGSCTPPLQPFSGIYEPDQIVSTFCTMDPARAPNLGNFSFWGLLDLNIAALDIHNYQRVNEEGVFVPPQQAHPLVGQAFFC